MFNLHGDIRNVEEETIYLQNSLNGYFKVQYETIKIDDSDIEYQEKYNNLSKCQLKKPLADLKQQKDDHYTSEIRYMSKLIRSK